MPDPKTIREIAERNVRALALKPSKGHLTGIAKAHWSGGLRCEVQEGPWTITSDMPTKAGGDGTAPTPGVLGRSALASCLVLGIAMWAARLAIRINTLDVEVQTDFDARGEMGVGDDVSPGYKEVRYIISIDTPANADEVAHLLETVERHSPYVDVFRNAQPMKRLLRVNGEEA